MTTHTTQPDQGQPRPVLHEAEAHAVRRGVPDPGIKLDPVTKPTVALFFGALAVWVVAAVMFFSGVTAWVTIPLHAAVSFVMFTVLHECTHHAAGRLDWVNTLFGRLSMLFVAIYGTFAMMKFVHIEHHRNTNEPQDRDPDSWISHGPKWQMPLRWPFIDIGYLFFFLDKHVDFRALSRTVTFRNQGKAPILLLDRQRAAIQLAWFFLVVGAFGALAWAGYGWEIVALYLVPQRIGVTFLAWWFDWLPHHGLKATSATNRFQATRVRVGGEWLLTPVLLYQNYHLVHHLLPLHHGVEDQRGGVPRPTGAHHDRVGPRTLPHRVPGLASPGGVAAGQRRQSRGPRARQGRVPRVGRRRGRLAHRGQRRYHLRPSRDAAGGVCLHPRPACGAATGHRR
jgi:fatty acid desaturase